MILLAWAMGAALMAFGFSVLVARYGARAGLVDIPNERSSHLCATPRGGGIGVPVSVILALIAMGASAQAWVPDAGISILGLVDDRWHIDARLRLVTQWVLALIRTICLMGQAALPTMTILLSAVAFVLVLVGTTNIYNFMDGVNGMAGLMGVVVFATLAVLASGFSHDVQVTRIAVVISAACVGFLPLNLRRQARVFMGDVCSTFLGFMAAILALRLGIVRPLWGVCALGSMMVFYVDSGWTLIARLHRHERLFEAHREHAYQRLANELGWSHPAVSFTYAGIQAIVSTLLVVSIRWGWGVVAGELAGVAIVLSGLYWYVQKKAGGRA